MLMRQLHGANAIPGLRAHVVPGDALLWAQAHGQPLTLIKALVAQRHGNERFRVLPGVG